MIRKMLENYPDTLSVEEVMSVLGIGKHTVKKWIKENKVDWKKIDTKYVISKQSLALMTFDQWTNGYKRTVKSGSSGIAVFDTQRKGRYLKYYFDIADTNIGSYSKPIPLWEIQPTT